ncbi:MAG: hypothetical protein ACFFBD_18045 [Candidatus Hodarchaeota archaeon]
MNILQDKNDNNVYGNFDQLNERIQELIEEYSLDEDILNINYLEWVEKANKTIER